VFDLWCVCVRVCLYVDCAYMHTSGQKEWGRVTARRGLLYLLHTNSLLCSGKYWSRGSARWGRAVSVRKNQNSAARRRTNDYKNVTKKKTVRGPPGSRGGGGGSNVRPKFV
jgi:hypothetical protein